MIHFLAAEEEFVARSGRCHRLREAEEGKDPPSSQVAYLAQMERCRADGAT